MHHLVIRVCFHPNRVLLSHGFVRQLRSPSPQLRIALASLRCTERTGRPTISNAIPVVSRPFTGGGLGSQTRHSLRSLSLQQRCLSSCQPVTDCVFRSPWSARIPALPRESVEVSQPGCRCYVPKRFVATAASVVLVLRLGLSIVRNQFANYWLAYAWFALSQHPKVSFSIF